MIFKKFRLITWDIIFLSKGATAYSKTAIFQKLLPIIFSYVLDLYLEEMKMEMSFSNIVKSLVIAFFNEYALLSRTCSF